MDEKVMELLEQCLFERAQVAYEQMMEAYPHLKEITHKAAVRSEEIEHSISMEAESKELMK